MVKRLVASSLGKTRPTPEAARACEDSSNVLARSSAVMRPFLTKRSRVALSCANEDTAVSAAAAMSMDLMVVFMDSM